MDNISTATSAMRGLPQPQNSCEHFTGQTGRGWGPKPWTAVIMYAPYGHRQADKDCRVEFSSVEVFEDVPLRDRLPGLGEHFVPVLHLDRAALGAEDELPDGLVASHAVVVHDADD